MLGITFLALPGLLKLLEDFRNLARFDIIEFRKNCPLDGTPIDDNVYKKIRNAYFEQEHV